jgi:twitching motility protein PilT
MQITDFHRSPQPLPCSNGCPQRQGSVRSLAATSTLRQLAVLPKNYPVCERLVPKYADSTMARVDSLLSILQQQNANELQLGTDREPRMLAHGSLKKLSLPATSEQTLRELLGEILTEEREQVIRARGPLQAKYVSATHGAFDVKITARPGDGFDVSFIREALAARALTPSPVEVDGSSVLTSLIARASALRASDVHLVDGAQPVARVDGRLRRLSDDAVDLGSVLPLEKAHMEQVLSGHSFEVAFDVAGVGRVRLHAFRVAEGLAVAIRLLPDKAPSLASLHMPVPLEDLVELPHGLVIVCGATGAGKSTTLAALAQEALRRRSVLLATLEDPIEYVLTAGDSSVLRRRQIGRDVPDFATGLRDALREDPDVLLLGEMRDPETITLALTAAETGHLVLSSLHSGSAVSAVERIVDAYPPERATQIRVQLADSLKAVVVQRLVPRAQGSGRLPAVEILRVTHAIASIIREGKTAQLPTAMQSGRREGMIPLERCLADRVIAGEVALEDARAAANDPGSLAMYLSK